LRREKMNDRKNWQGRIFTLTRTVACHEGGLEDVVGLERKGKAQHTRRKKCCLQMRKGLEGSSGVALVSEAVCGEGWAPEGPFVGRNERMRGEGRGFLDERTWKSVRPGGTPCQEGALIVMNNDA
jgi:hypothetical protein